VIPPGKSAVLSTFCELSGPSVNTGAKASGRLDDGVDDPAAVRPARPGNDPGNTNV
jgi:hypothetical protein